jgi:CRISPR-associated endonuclease/helicase Cas3
MSDFPSFYRYWGKTQPAEDLCSDAYHLLCYHCLDVAAVAAYWWDHSVALRQRFCCSAPGKENEIRAWVLFFIALHDIGKWDLRFQCKVYAAWVKLHPEDAKLKLPPYETCRDYDHGAAGLFWFIEDFQPSVSNSYILSFDEPPAHPYVSWLPWIEAVAGHHGYVRQAVNIASDLYQMPTTLRAFSACDKAARREWIIFLEQLFLQPAGLTLESIPPDISTLLAGFCSVSDWLGSWRSDDTFQNCASLPETSESLKSYFALRYEKDAALVIERSGLLTTVNACSGVQALLDKGYVPRQLQILVDQIVFPAPAGINRGQF